MANECHSLPLESRFALSGSLGENWIGGYVTTMNTYNHLMGSNTQSCYFAFGGSDWRDTVHKSDGDGGGSASSIHTFST
ncbi:MAG TPA: hypothetical protein VNQ76_00355 [Planctomicrobium sp.]|nr:hypothetical protein [Planctomicrobium sp.]